MASIHHFSNSINSQSYSISDWNYYGITIQLIMNVNKNSFVSSLYENCKDKLLAVKTREKNRKYR